MCVSLTLLETLSSSCANMFPFHGASSYRLLCSEDACSRCALRCFIHFFTPKLLHPSFYQTIDSFINTIKIAAGKCVARKTSTWIIRTGWRWKEGFIYFGWTITLISSCGSLSICLSIDGRRTTLFVQIWHLVSKAFECDSALMNLCSSVIPFLKMYGGFTRLTAAVWSYNPPLRN